MGLTFFVGFLCFCHAVWNVSSTIQERALGRGRCSCSYAGGAAKNG